MDSQVMDLFVTVFRDGQQNRRSLKVKKTDTIKDVTFRIGNEEGLDPERLYLVTVNPKAGLEDMETLEDLDIHDGHELFLAEIKTPESRVEYGRIEILIQMVYTGDTRRLVVDRSDSIGTLESMIEEKFHIPNEMQQLSTSYKRRLNGKHKSLDDYSICHGDTLLLDVGGPITVNVFLIDSQRIVPLEVEILDKVDAVKSKIQDVEGIPASKQWLFNVDVSDMDLMGCRTLADCEIGPGDTIYLQIAPMRINIKFFQTKETICLKVDESETIDNVKAKIELKIGVSSEKLAVYYFSVLSLGCSFKGNLTLGECKIRNGDTLVCDFEELFLSIREPYIKSLSARWVQIGVTTSTGEIVLLEVDLSLDTVSRVRSLIESKQGFLLSHHAIFCDGEQLAEDLLLSKIIHKSVLFCLPKPRARLQILVKMTSNGKTIVLKVKSTKTVGNLLRKIREMEDISSDQHHKLVFDGEELNNDNTVLKCKIRWNSLLFMVPYQE